jgi:Family of unknown function (DUF6600)/FecR protein
MARDTYREKVTCMTILQRFKLLPDVSALALCAIVALCALAPVPSHAQDQDEMPARVGRIADVSGQLFHAPEDRAGEWAPIGLNYPITTGDSLWISGDGRAEIDFGGGQFRLAGDTNVHVSRLDEREFSLFLAQGRIIVRIRALEAGEEARVDTPNSQISLTRPGLYRIDVSDDRQETTVVVREGEAVAGVTNGTQQILPGQTATLFGAGDVQADVRNGTGLDGFDSWSASRDRHYRANRSTAYVSEQMVGYADLDQYGSWQTYPEYGPVWFPTSVAADWAPYRYGRWTSLPAWGWTWVDDAPWGYAPFHYGRWAYVGGRWGWCPGTYVRKPVWAPALVAWYGGSGWGVSASHGAPVYGWVPLGWREPYVPSWRNCGSRCWTAYNRPYAVNVAERPRQPPTYYANHRVPGAITAVPGAALASGKPVRPNIVNVPGNLAATAPVMTGAPQVKPMPVTANVVRPGNGVPPPASEWMSRTKPMPVPSAGRTTIGSPLSPGADGRKPSYGQPSNHGQAAPGGITAVPPGANRSAPAYNAAEMPQRYGRPNAEAGPGASVALPTPRPGPAAVPPGSSNVTSVPPGRYRPPAVEGSAVPSPQMKPAPQVNRAEGGGRPLPPSMQPQAPPPQASPQAVRAAPPPQHVAPVAPQASHAAPPAPPPQQQAPRAEKPVAVKPGPVQAEK